jgi:hypothetical protein
MSTLLPLKIPSNHFRGVTKMVAARIGRAFSPQSMRVPRSWGDAPGWYGMGPSALKSRQAPEDVIAPLLRANGAMQYQPGASPQDMPTNQDEG